MIVRLRCSLMTYTNIPPVRSKSYSVPIFPLLPAGKCLLLVVHIRFRFLLSIEATAPLRTDIFLYISGIEFHIDLAELFLSVNIVLVHLCKS